MNAPPVGRGDTVSTLKQGVGKQTVIGSEIDPTRTNTVRCVRNTTGGVLNPGEVVKLNATYTEAVAKCGATTDLRVRVVDDRVASVADDDYFLVIEKGPCNVAKLSATVVAVDAFMGPSATAGKAAANATPASSMNVLGIVEVAALSADTTVRVTLTEPQS